MGRGRKGNAEGEEEGEESNAKNIWEKPRLLNGVMIPAAMMLPLRATG